MSSGLFKLIVQFENADGGPLTGANYRVKAYDDDPLVDGYLGESGLSDSGEASFLIAVADIKSIDSPNERTPDLYFVLLDNGSKVYKSAIFKDVDFEQLNPVTERTHSLTQTLGPIRVNLDNN